MFLERIGNSYLSINYFSDLSGALRISESKKDNQDAAEAYKILQKRSVNDESELKIYESLSYVINQDELESFILSSVDVYGN